MSDFDSCISEAAKAHHLLVNELIVENKALAEQLERLDPALRVQATCFPQRDRKPHNSLANALEAIKEVSSCQSSMTSLQGFTVAEPQRSKEEEFSIELLEDSVAQEKSSGEMMFSGQPLDVNQVFLSTNVDTYVAAVGSPESPSSPRICNSLQDRSTDRESPVNFPECRSEMDFMHTMSQQTIDQMNLVYRKSMGQPSVQKKLTDNSVTGIHFSPSTVQKQNTGGESCTGVSLPCDALQSMFLREDAVSRQDAVPVAMTKLTIQLNQLARQLEDNFRITKAMHQKVKRKEQARGLLSRISASQTVRSTMAKSTSMTSSKTTMMSMLDRTQAAMLTQKSLSNNQPLRQSIWRTTEDPNSGSCARCFDAFRMYMDIFAFFFALLQAVVPPESQPLPVLRRGRVSAAIFDGSIEVIFLLLLTVRLIVCPQKCLFWFDCYNIIDLVACLPLGFRVAFLLMEDAGHDVRNDSRVFMSFICTVPVLRILKWVRCFETCQLLTNAFMEAAEVLPVLLFTMVCMVLTFAVAIYYFEPRDTIETYLESVYFVIVTLSTVGYGDISPTTIGGKVCSCVLIVVGPLYMAIPIGIVGTSFRQAWEDRHRWLFLSQLRTRVVHAGYQPKDIEKIFKLLDKEQRGVLTLDEFRNMIEVLDIDADDECVTIVFDVLDRDAGGSIDFQELLHGLFPEAYLYVFRRTSGQDDGSGQDDEEPRDTYRSYIRQSDAGSGVDSEQFTLQSNSVCNSEQLGTGARAGWN